MTLITHLSFRGQCAEAFAFYAKCLRGGIEFSMTYGESPMAAQFGPEAQKMIMHTSLVIGDARLTGADAPGEHFKKPQGFAVTVNLDDEAEADRIYNELSEGANIQMPIQKTFWARRFAMLVDRFGTPWMINCGNAAA